MKKKPKVRKAASLKPKPIKKKKASVKKAAPAPPAPDVQNEDFSRLGRQPVEFYVEHYGPNFRVIDNMGFVFSNGRWIAVDVDGFTYMEREICPGDPQFVVV